MTNPVFIKEHVVTNNRNNVVFREKMLNGFNVVTSLIDNNNQANHLHQTFTIVEEKEEVKKEVKKETARPDSWDSISPASSMVMRYDSPIGSKLIGVNALLTSHVDINEKTEVVSVYPFYDNSNCYSRLDNRQLTESIKEVFDVTAVVIRGSDGKLHNTDSVAYIECCKILFKYARGTFIINSSAVFSDDNDKPIGTVIDLPMTEDQAYRNQKWPFDAETVTQALMSALLSTERVNDLIFLGVDPYQVLTVNKIIEISTEWAANGEECAVVLHNYVPVMTVYDKVNYQKMEKLVRYTEYEERTPTTVNKFF